MNEHQNVHVTPRSPCKFLFDDFNDYKEVIAIVAPDKLASIRRWFSFSFYCIVSLPSNEGTPERRRHSQVFLQIPF